MARIPVNIITGFLGVGKTTAILNLLRNKPAGENWAVVVNEFGEVGIDGPIISQIDKNILIKDISGGCMCCIGKTMFDAAMAQIAVKMKPDRILIEPSGLGHIGDLIRTMQSKTFKNYVAVKAPICLIDPKMLNDAYITESIVFKGQLEKSDIIISNKCDLASLDDIEFFEQWAAGLQPPKLKILQTSQGIIPLDILDDDFQSIGKEEIIIHSLFMESKEKVKTASLPSVKQPVMIENTDSSFSGVGWIFSSEDILDFFRLQQFITDTECVRCKGILRTNEGWFVFQKILNETTVDKSLEHSDSRFEMIFKNNQKPDVIVLDTFIKSLIL